MVSRVVAKEVVYWGTEVRLVKTQRATAATLMEERSMVLRGHYLSSFDPYAKMCFCGGVNSACSLVY